MKSMNTYKVVKKQIKQERGIFGEQPSPKTLIFLKISMFSGNHVIRGHGPAGDMMGVGGRGTETLVYQWFLNCLKAAWTVRPSGTGPITPLTKAQNHCFPKGFQGFWMTV